MKISKLLFASSFSSPVDFDKFQFPPDFVEFKNPVPLFTKKGGSRYAGNCRKVHVLRMGQKLSCSQTTNVLLHKIPVSLCYNVSMYQEVPLTIQVFKTCQKNKGYMLN